MVAAERIFHLILDGDVDEAISISDDCLEVLSLQQHSDVVYLEPRMQDESGHFCRLATTYENLMSTKNLKMAVLHRRGWDSEKRQGWSGVFPVPDHIIGVGTIADLGQLAGFVQYFEYLYSKCLSKIEASLVVFPTIRFLTVLAAIRAVEASPRVFGTILGVMETDLAPDCSGQDLIDSAFRSASELMLASKKTFLVFAESDSIRDYLLRSGFPADRVFVNPYPAANRFGGPDAYTGPSMRKHFGCLGGMRGVQNPDLLATYLLKTSHHPVDWTVRLNLKLVAQKLNVDVSELRHTLRNAKINLLEHRLENDEYDQVIQSFDTMLLPYGDRYKTIGSGIFLESICSGVVPLVPAKSTMYGLYLELGGQAPPIENLSVEAIGTPVDYCVRKLGELRANARQVRSAWLSHKQGPLNWSHHVLTFVQKQF